MIYGIPTREKTIKQSDDRDAIEKKYEFKNFTDAFEWMSKVAVYADEKDHHPEWFNVYNRVDVLLSTHDAGGFSEKDVDLANKMDDLLET